MYTSNLRLKTTVLFACLAITSLSQAESQNAAMDAARTKIHNQMSADEVANLRLQITEARYQDDQRYINKTAEQVATQESIFNQLQAGDILLVRSSSLQGSIAARAPDVPGQFSHLIFIAQDPETKQLSFVESDQGYGIKIEKFDIELLRRRVRIGLFRHKDSALAKKAAQRLYAYVSEKEQESHIKYDNHLNIDDHSTVYCTELATLAFNLVNEKVPESLSKITFLTEKIRSKLNMPSNDVFTPIDLEVDSRFSLIQEYRNPDLLQTTYESDAIFGKFFQWVREGKEEFSPGLVGHVAGFIGGAFFEKKISEELGEEFKSKAEMSNMVKYGVGLLTKISFFEGKLKEALRFEKNKKLTVKQYEDQLQVIQDTKNQLPDSQ